MDSSISVVIPAYNGSAFLAQTLASVFAQTELPAEIVVVDDCSTDETQATVQAIARESPVPLHLIPLAQNYGGPSKPLNVGIEATRSDVIALLDQDDLMRPKRIEVQGRAVRACAQCSIAIGRFSIIGYAEEDMTPMWPVPQFHELASEFDEKSDYSVVDSETAFKPLLNRNYAGSTSNFCFTKRWWQTIGGFDETVRTCTDLDFILRATIAGPIAVVNEKIFDYRWTKDSLQRRNVTTSLLEATMVRLRAASLKPEWAEENLEALRHSALMLANAAIRKGDFKALRALAEAVAQHKALGVVKQTVKNKTRRAISLLTS
jgi:glycosyltransferase involved in cell wall biosynthesis